MATIARRTLINLFDCIRYLLFRSIDSIGLNLNRYHFCDLIEKSRIKAENTARKMLINLSHPIEEVQESRVMTIKVPISNILIHTSSADLPSKCFDKNIKLDLLNKNSYAEELYFIDSTPSYCYFIIQNTCHNTRVCQQLTLRMIQSPENKNKNNIYCADIKNTASSVTVPRHRTCSDSSEDNFIFFENDVPDSDANTKSTKTYEYYSNQYDSDSDGSSDSEIGSENEDENCSLLSDKKVRFNMTPRIHVMYAWNYAYRSARKGHWENFARDRVRFQLRINRAAKYLDEVLTSNHRKKVYNARFAE